MAKTKGKAKIAASNAPSKVEAVSGNDKFAESVPSESMETEKAATTMVIDKSEEVAKIEEIEDGSDSEEVEESEEIENGLDESEEVEGTEKNEDGLESQEVDETKESKDGLDASEDVDKIGETKDASEKNDEGDKEGKTKEDGKVKPVGTDGPESEKAEERNVTGEVKDNGKVENASDKKAKRIRKRRKGAAGTASSNDANKSCEADKQGTSIAAKDLKMADGMGLIFMCNAKTKKDCFQYKVFGLPASKKEMVAKVYKGMRLFLFDIDLKLMYGIYKAASPGGYDIEPKAFKSAFPSQVRFTVLKDCLPLPEEKFKSAIKENYYGRNKFNCQLSSEQVKNLCKLFQSAVQTSKKRSGEVIRAEQEPNSSSRGRKRPHHEGEAFRAKQERSFPSWDRKRPRREREVTRAEQERISSSRGRNRSRHERTRRNDSIPSGRGLYARREAYASQPPRLLAPPPPLPSLPYAYVQPVDDYYYRRDPPLIDPRDHRAVHLETRTYEPLEYRDPYRYREPLPREAVYREPLSREAVYREPLPREAVYGEPVPYTIAANPASLTSAAYDRPATHYRY